MIKILRSDLLHSRRTLGIFGLLLLGMLFYHAWRGLTPKPFVVFGCIVAAMAPMAAVAQEDKFKTLSLTCSLPVRRDDVVTAKYAGAWLTGLAGYLGIVAVGLVLSPVSFPASSLCRLDLVFTAVLTLAVTISLLLPFTLRFGLMGLLLFGVIAQILGIVAFGLMVVGVGRQLIRASIGSVVGAMARLEDFLGEPGYSIALLAGAVALNLGSYLAARRLFRQREF